MPELATELYHDLRSSSAVFYDDSGAIGRRYRRMDEAGTPFVHHGGRRDPGRPDGDGAGPRLRCRRSGLAIDAVVDVPPDRLRGPATAQADIGRVTRRDAARRFRRDGPPAWPPRCRRSISTAVAEVDGVPRDLPASDPRRRLHAGRVRSAAAIRTAIPNPSRAASCSTTAPSRRSAAARSGVRLAGGGLGDADPRAAAPPRVAGRAPRPGGARRGRRSRTSPGRTASRSIPLFYLDGDSRSTGRASGSRTTISWTTSGSIPAARASSSGTGGRYAVALTILEGLAAAGVPHC